MQTNLFNNIKGQVSAKTFQLQGENITESKGNLLAYITGKHIVAGSNQRMICRNEGSGD